MPQPHEEIREQLHDRLRALEQRLGRIATDRRHEATPLERDFAEQAVQRENDEVLDALDESGRREFDELQQALGRMEAGSYGICEECEEPISDARLRVLLTATRCVECAE